MATMIKFRAWDKAQNKMLLPDNIEFINGQAYWAEASIGDNGSYSNDGKIDGIGALFELEQFTGLTDVNGKDIYEGDIIKYTSEDGAFFYAEVKYFADDDNYPAFDFIPPDEDWHFQSNCLSEGTFSNALEVVGNVHENPELLEEEK